MSSIRIKQHPQIQAKFESYPAMVQEKLNQIRGLIIEVASNIEHIQEIEETLKWGEPSYIVKKGSTIRMDWKAKTPNQFAIYFNCNTSLVNTFKILYGDLFKYEKNRAIWFELTDTVPKTELKSCITMALQYYLLKDKPLLGN